MRKSLTSKPLAVLSFSGLASVAASPAFAAGSGGFWSLTNTDFVVLLAFILFIAVLIYFKVPGMIIKLLDQRADGIQDDLDEARGLREEAQGVLASFERKQKEVQAQADRIVASAKQEAQAAADAAKVDLEKSIARRVAAAEEQITSAQDAAVREVRNEAITVAVAAARDVIAQQMSAAERKKLNDDAIGQVETRLN